MWNNCAFYDKSMTFGRQLLYTLRKIFVDMGHRRFVLGREWRPFYKMADILYYFAYNP